MKKQMLVTVVLIKYGYALVEADEEAPAEDVQKDIQGAVMIAGKSAAASPFIRQEAMIRNLTAKEN